MDAKSFTRRPEASRPTSCSPGSKAQGGGEPASSQRSWSSAERNSTPLRVSRSRVFPFESVQTCFRVDTRAGIALLSPSCLSVKYLGFVLDPEGLLGSQA